VECDSAENSPSVSQAAQAAGRGAAAVWPGGAAGCAGEAAGLSRRPGRVAFGGRSRSHGRLAADPPRL